MKKKIFKNMEWGILICSVLLLVIGMVALFSATQNADYEEFKKQGLWFLISIPIMMVVILIDYQTIAKLSPFFLWTIYNPASRRFFYGANKWCN